MKKYFLPALIALVLLFGGTFTVNTALAKSMSIKDFVNLLILIGVIPTDRIAAVNAVVANLGAATSTASVGHATSGSGGGS